MKSMVVPVADEPFRNEPIPKSSYNCWSTVEPAFGRTATTDQ